MFDFGEALRQAVALVCGFDPGLFSIIALSLQVSIGAVIVAALLGLPIGAALAVGRFPGRYALTNLLNALMGLPPVVAGLVVAWYRDTGSGMGPALNTAAAMNAYVLADRGTWLRFKNPGELFISIEGDRRLFNPYGVILVNPLRHPHVRKVLGQQFIDWLVSADGQAAIESYRIGGEQLFFAHARP